MIVTHLHLYTWRAALQRIIEFAVACPTGAYAAFYCIGSALHGRRIRRIAQWTLAVTDRYRKRMTMFILIVGALCRRTSGYLRHPCHHNDLLGCKPRLSIQVNTSSGMRPFPMTGFFVLTPR
jgi:hypothetical protein